MTAFSLSGLLRISNEALAVVREQHGIAFALEAFAQLLGHLALVLDDQDPHRLSVCLAGARGCLA